MSLAELRDLNDRARAAEKLKSSGGGLFGTGIGPDINLGGVTALKELGSGIWHLASMVPDLAPGGMPAGERWSKAGKGMLSYLAGVPATLAEGVPIPDIIPDSLTPWTEPDEREGGNRIIEGYKDFVGEALAGDDPPEAYRPQSFREAVSERGLVPGLADLVGQVSLAGAAITAPVKGAAGVARVTGQGAAAQRLLLRHARLSNDPLVRAIQHPYRTAARALDRNWIQPGAARFNAAQGIDTRPLDQRPIEDIAADMPDTGIDFPSVRVSDDLQTRLAQAYAEMPDSDAVRLPPDLDAADARLTSALDRAWANLAKYAEQRGLEPPPPRAPDATAAYRAFVAETNEQFRHLTEDLGYKVEFVDEDPYPNAAAMAKDVRENKRIKVMRTKDGEHPYLTPEENDRFRAVHDIYGHAGTGRDFARHGEEAAFLAHSSMYSPLAQKALASETRGQNAVLIKTGDFGPQKASLLPDELADPSESAAMHRKAPPEPPRPGDSLAAALDRRIAARRAHNELRRQTRLAEMERSIAARSPVVRAGVRTAEDLVLRKAQEGGRRMTRQQASLMVGEEIHARYTGLKALEQAYPDVPKDVWQRLGIRQHWIPDDLWDTELEGSIAGAVDLQKAEHARVREILESGRQGDTGLTGLAAEDAVTPGMTRLQTRELRNAQKMLERAESEILARKEARERLAREREAARLEDRLGRLAEQKQALLDDDAAAVEAFDHSRAGKIRGFQTPERMAANLQAVYERTLANVEQNGGEWGGASWNPHTEKFVTPGEDSGYAVGLVKGTARKVPIEEFTPADLDLVARAHQEVLQHPNVVLGTWVEDGFVYIDPSEIIQNPAEALVRGAAREQLAIFDIRRAEAPSGILSERPDLAGALLSRNTFMKRRADEFMALTKTTGLSVEDLPAWLDMNLRMAAAAVDKGVIKHPDEWFQKFVLKSAKKPSPKGGVLRQIVLEEGLGDTPQERLARYQEIRSFVDEADKVMRWYDESNTLVERLFRNKPDLTLLDGTKINPADLFYQILAVTSFQATPRDNLTRAFMAMQRFNDLPKKEVRALRKAMERVTSGKATLEEAFGDGVGKNLAEQFGGFALYPEPKKYIAEIISGRTIDTWTPEYLAEIHEAMGGKAKFLDRQRALDFLREHYPEALDEIGEDAAIKEFYSRSHRAKIISFWDNLRDPENSLSVTMDMQMERFFGEEMPLGQTRTGQVNDAWVRRSQEIRDLARQISETTGETVRPHQLQALLWVYAKQRINDLQMGHFNAFAADAQDLVAKGIQITDAADPIVQWIDEASAPYASGEQRVVQTQRILGKAGERTEDVIYRPGWGSSNRSKVLNLFEKRRARWLLAREQINASLAVGDQAAAHRHLDDFIEHMRTKAPRSDGLLDDASGANFADIWENPAFHSKGLKQAAASFEGLDVPLGEYPSLLQSFHAKVLGEFVPMADEARGIIRIFESGNLQTLVHEQGHLLRRLLPEAEMRAVEKAYGIKPGKAWSVAAEEKFANDLVRYMVTEKAPKGLGTAFQRVKQALSAVWKFAKGSFERGRIHPDLKPVFDSWFEPALRETGDLGPYPGIDVTPETGTIAQRAARPPKMPQPPNKSGEFYAAGRKGQAALARLEKNAMKRRALNVAEKKTQRALDDIRTVLAEGRLPSALERDALRAKAAKIMERVNDELATPSVSRTPTRWQPLWHAVQDLAKEAESNPALADMLSDLPQTLYDVQRLALEKGFDPVHFREFSPTQVRRLVWGNMRLGRAGDAAHEAPAGTRKTRTGALRRQRGVDRSLEAFFASTVEAISEQRTNAVIDWVERNAARTIEHGAPIPEGWTLWDPMRTYLLTGTELSPDGLRQVQTAANHVTIIPESVSKTLSRFSKDYDHWSVRAIRKITSPWRTLVLTFSPGWYVRNIVGNIMLAEAEGVRLRDWKAAWRSAKTKDEIGRFADIPFVSGHTLADEAGIMADSSLIPRTLADAQVEAGNLRGTAQHLVRSLLRANEVVDEFARAAVYHQGLRLNMTPEQAWTRAKTALVDYSALSGFERSVVRSVIPFYAWQKGILKVVLNQAIDHPARTSILMLLGQMQEEYVADMLGLEPQDVPEFYSHLTGDRNFRSFNPFADPTEIVTPEGITRSLNPFLEIAVRKGLGAPEFYTDQRRLGFFGTPQQDVDVGAELTELVTRSPGGRIISDGPGSNAFGLLPSRVDTEALRSRLLRARKTIRGIDNPETGQPAPLLPTRG